MQLKEYKLFIQKQVSLYVPYNMQAFTKYMKIKQIDKHLFDELFFKKIIRTLVRDLKIFNQARNHFQPQTKKEKSEIFRTHRYPKNTHINNNVFSFFKAFNY